MAIMAMTLRISALAAVGNGMLLRSANFVMVATSFVMASARMSAAQLICFSLPSRSASLSRPSSARQVGHRH